MADQNKCDICGRKFDSERGMKVHKSQMHDEDEKQKEETSMTENNQEIQTVNLTLKHAMIGVFLLGLSIGFAGGQFLGGPTVVQGTTGDVVDQPSDTGDSNQDAQDSEGTQVSGSTPKEVFQNIANNIGADSEQMTSCFESSSGQEASEDSSEIDQLTQRVINERDLNRRAGIGTPTFLIGNDEIGYELVSGAQPMSNLQPTIEEQLSEAQNPESDTIETGTPFNGPGEVELEEISLEGEPTQGSSDAPINFIEYSDFGCPWCAEWHGVDAIPSRDIDSQQPYQTLVSDYVEPGDVQFYFKDYPVSRLHPNAPDAHKAANCILEQDEEKFWEFYDSLFENRGQWTAG